MVYYKTGMAEHTHRLYTGGKSMSVGPVIVTRSNFGTLLPGILHHIRECDFVTIDTELSGLCRHSSQRYSRFDTPEERYLKLADSANTFGLLQFGLSAFKWNRNAHQFEAHTWSFHVLPPKITTSQNDHRAMSLQLSAVHFLAQHNFDFNGTFVQGIPYVSRFQEQQSSSLSARRNADSTSQASFDEVMVKASAADAQFLEECMQMLRDAKEASGGDFSAIEAINFPSCNSFRRLLLHRKVPLEFPTVSLKKSVLCNDVLVATFNKTQEEKEAEFEKELATSAGFRRVVDMILNNNKPLVGHNCWLDIMHLYRQFIGPFPDSLDAFRSAWNRLTRAPVFDTKLLARWVFAVLEDRPCSTLPMEFDVFCSPSSEISSSEVSLENTSDSKGEMEESGTKQTTVSLTMAGSNLEGLATLMDSNSLWGVRVPVAPAESNQHQQQHSKSDKKATMTATERANESKVAAQFHDAGYDAYCTGKVFVGMASMMAHIRAVMQSGSSVDDKAISIRDVKTSASVHDVHKMVRDMIFGELNSHQFEMDGNQLVVHHVMKGYCRGDLNMMTSDYEMGVALTDLEMKDEEAEDLISKRVSDRQMHPDRSRLVLVTIQMDDELKDALQVRTNHLTDAVRRLLVDSGVVGSITDESIPKFLPVQWIDDRMALVEAAPSAVDWDQLDMDNDGSVVISSSVGEGLDLKTFSLICKPFVSTIKRPRLC